MTASEPLIARGRSADVFASDPDRVRVRYREPRDVRRQAELMTRAAAAGYPAPRVFEVGHSELVMERIQGPTMFEDLVARPERLEEHAALLADLHDRLHRLGIRHRDLHPQNVILAGSGPTVIDWEAADEGDPSVDIAETWVLLAAAELQPEIARARDRFLAIFLRHVDRDAARASLAVVVANRQRDPHMTAMELERMGRAVGGGGAIGIFLARGVSVNLTHRLMHAIGSRLLGFTQERFDESRRVDEIPASVLRRWPGGIPISRRYPRRIHTTESRSWRQKVPKTSSNI